MPIRSSARGVQIQGAANGEGGWGVIKVELGRGQTVEGLVYHTGEFDFIL